MADGSQNVKALILRAEDARLMADMSTMKQHYTDLMALNESLIAEYFGRVDILSVCPDFVMYFKRTMRAVQRCKNEQQRCSHDRARVGRRYNKRATNHEALLTALKEVNQVVQRAANLRVGAAKARVVAEARKAIKANDVRALVQLVQEGQATFGVGG